MSKLDPDPNADLYAGPVLTAAEEKRAFLSRIVLDLHSASRMAKRAGRVRDSEDLRHAANLVANVTERNA